MPNAQKPKNSEARIRANNKYRKKTYIRLALDLRPEDLKRITDYAALYKMPRTRYIINACEYYHQTHPINPGAVNPDTPAEITTDKPDDHGEDQGKDHD